MWIGFFGVALSFGSLADTIALQWDPAVGDPLVAGYEVRYGLQSERYQWVVQADADAGATNTATIDGLVPGNTYYFAVRSRNSDASLASTFSNELSVTIESLPETTAPSVPSREGLVAAYGFDEDQGMIVVDASGNGNDGSLFGATRTTAGRSGSALAFDGTDDRVDLNALDISGGNGLTISAWMKADDFGTYDARLVSKATGVQENDHYWMVSTFSNNSIRFRLKAGGSTTTLISPNGVVKTDEWHHVAATYDGARMTLYVDGAQVASKSKSGVIATNSSVPGAIGDQPQGGTPFDGSIDEVRIYNRALTIADIQTDMTSTDITAPSVAIAASPTGPTYTSAQSVAITATAGDGVGVTRVEFYDGATLRGTDTTAPYSHQWAITDAENGTHTWTAKAFDAAGNAGTASSLSLGVNIPPPPPVADFLATTATTGVAPLAVSFRDTSSGEISARSWDFGDGQGANPGASSTSHTYTQPGTYDVRLTVSGPGGSDSATAVVLVTAAPDTIPDPAGDLPEGLTAAYRFEEDQGMVVVDASGNGNDGSLFGATRTTAGRSGSALAFDGTDDRVDLNALDISGGDGLTISVWMKADDFGTYDARLVSKATGSQENDHYWMLSTFSNNSVRFRLKAGGSTATLISSSNVIAAGKWHHVAATYDGTRMTLFVDGAQVASKSKSGSIATNSGVPAAIGNQPHGGLPFDGSIDEVRMYNRALSVADIQTDMTTTVAVSADTTDTPPVADFLATTATTGVAPLVVGFRDTSSGGISARSWDFGDGQGANPGASSTSHTYTQPGTYDVRLTVSGPGGYDSATAVVLVTAATDTTGGTLSDLLDVGVVEVGDEWQWVDFAMPFADAIVVAKPLSYNDTDPAVVRVDGIDANGFWIRVQEWDYLDGTHAPEVVSYLVVERGLHQLTDNTWIEAGRIESDAGIETAFVDRNFQAPFTQTPVVLTAVSSDNGGDPVITRVRNIDDTGFQVRLQEEQAADQIPMPAAIDYIAWEPSSGIIDGVEFEVGRTANEVTHVAHILAYEKAFLVAPVFLADMQTQNGSDAANLRWQNKSASAVDVSIAEEQSNDYETNHVAETVGYVAIGPAP